MHVQYSALISRQPGVITVSVIQGNNATPGATKQLLPPDRVFKRIIYIYIYIRQLKAEIILYVLLPF